MLIPSSFHALSETTVRVKITDIGANPVDGDPSYHWLLVGGHADIVGFEPIPEALAELNEKKGPNETYLPYAVGDGKRHTLNVCFAPGLSSLLKPNPDVTNMFHGFPLWSRIVSTMDLDTVRLDDIPETAGSDLIKIDVQGAELMVFENATARLADTLVIHTEVEFLPFYQNQPLFGDVDVFLRKHGFVFHRFFPLVSRIIPPMAVPNDPFAGYSQSVWADAIFVRDFSKLSLLSPRQLLAMAAIIHDCYKSFDLVQHILLEHDRRTGANVALTYMNNLAIQIERQFGPKKA